MTTHPYIPLYVDDFEAATAHLSIEEDGVYNRLLRLCWRTPGCSLPNDPVWIARKIRVSQADFDRIAAPVLAEFFRLVRGRFAQRRLKAEYDDISRKKNARAAAGKKGGDAKARKTHEKTVGNASDLPADTHAFQTHTQNQKEEVPPEPPEGANQLDLIGDEPEGVDEVQAAFDAWNDLARRCGLPVAKSLDQARRRAIGKRLKDEGLEGWTEALKGVEGSAFLRGQRPGNDGRTMKADLGFVCQAKSFPRLREGFYGQDAKAEPPAPAGPKATFPNAELRAAVSDVAGKDFVVGFLDRCGWVDLPAPAIVAPTRFIADRLKRDIGPRLREWRVAVAVQQGAAA